MSTSPYRSWMDILAEPSATELASGSKTLPIDFHAVFSPRSPLRAHVTSAKPPAFAWAVPAVTNDKAIMNTTASIATILLTLDAALPAAILA